MTTSTPLGERQHIDIRAIERELTALWQQSEDTEGGENHAPVTRACVMTLIATVSSRRASDEVTRIIDQLTDRYPNRAIVVNAAPEAPDDMLEAWVQAHCQMPGPNQSQVCCEQITIEAHGPAVARVPGTILPLLVADVPVVVWWPRGTPFDSAIFAKAIDLADRVIVDSTTFLSPERQLSRLVGILDERRTVSDLAWARLTPWRELTAQFFDSAGMRQHLDSIEQVVVTYKQRPDEQVNRTQALFFVGWLAAKLGWEPPSEALPSTANATFPMQRGDTAVQISLRGIAPDDSPDDQLVSVELVSTQASFTITAGEVEHCAVAFSEIQGRQPLRRVVRLEHYTLVDLLGEELRLLGRDRGFEGALNIAARLANGR